MLSLFVTLQTWVQSRASREEGATAVEYGLMVALIAIVIITAVALVGTNLKKVFEDVASKIVGL